MSRSVAHLTREDLDELGTAAVVSNEHLAIELERLGLSDPEHSLQDAKRDRDAAEFVAHRIPTGDADLDRTIHKAKKEWIRRHLNREGNGEL